MQSSSGVVVISLKSWCIDTNGSLFVKDLPLLFALCRIAVTLVSDPGANLIWKDVREVVIGRITNTREYRPNEHGDMSVLSLNLLPVQLLTVPMDDR